MMGADIGSRLAERHPDDEDWLFRNYFELTGGRAHKRGEVAIVFDGMGGRYTRVGLLLADVVREEDCTPVKVDLSPQEIADLAEQARAAVAERLRLDIEPRLLAFTHYT